MSLPLPSNGFDPDTLLLIVHGPVPFVVVVSGYRREDVVEAYKQAGLQVEIIEQQRAAS